MDTIYKVTLFNKRIFREISLDPERTVLTVGTDKSCNVRFNRESFFGDFGFSIRAVKDAWQIRCGENTYLSDSGMLKFSSKGLNHGDTYSIRYQDSGQEIFKLSFTLDFDAQLHHYDHVVGISGVKSVTLGSASSNNIVLPDTLLEEKAAELVPDGDTWILRDLGGKYGAYVNGTKVQHECRLKNYDFFSLLGYSFFLKDSSLYYDGSTGLHFNKLTPQVMQREGSCLEYPKFNRNTRLKYVISEEPIPVLDPDKKPEKPKNNLVTSLLPAIASILLILILRGGMLSGKANFLENLSQNSFILFSVASMGIGACTTVLALFMSKKEYRESIQKREDVYLKYIENKGKEVDEARAKERELLNNIYVPVEQELQQMQDFSGDLFDKSLQDEDFLHVRLGLGSLPARRKIDYKKQERLETDDILMQKPEDLYNEFKNVDDVPVVVKLKETNAVGVVGTPELLYRMMKNMVIDVCVRHYHKDVKLFFIFDEKDAQRFAWARWFQNLQNDSMPLRNIVCDDESKNNLFEFLYVELSRREAEKSAYPNVVVMVFDDVGIKLHPLSKYITRAKEFGFSFIFFENYKELLPQGCDNIIMLNPDGCTGRLIPVQDVNEAADFKYTTIADEDALYIAQRSASVYCEEVGLESSLTKNITLFELLHILTPQDLDLGSRWSASEVYKSMAAPLGVMRKNEVVALDLHEKAHGPHGLVAGTTGSGKSEILQSYVLSIATLFHPYEVSFVIIDFKGGGMVNQFKNLPHLIGAITNIDGAEINRSLLSIKAELIKRQSLFAQADVNHIDQYIKKFKAHEVEVALPHLIIIVDEFAELKAEQPEFMKELISTARIGRSLGVHLILATQKPAGQVNEQIWSNSKFKLCLKVQTKEDSNEVLKSPLAAEIKEPGRAYLQVGNNEIFELFQSAYSGASASVNDDGIKNEFTLSGVSLAGVRVPFFVQKNKKSAKESVTQLQAIVDYVADYCERANIPHLPEICLPPLAEIIEVDEAPMTDDMVLNSRIPIGIYDDPSRQYQGTIEVDLAEENVMLIGSSRFGKTNFLQLIIRSLASRFSPEEVNIYILDFASMVLKNFEALNHVGGVVCASDDEKLKNFFKLINTEIATRKKTLMNVGVSSFSSYREAGYTDLPQIVVIVDNLTALKEMYLQEEDPLLVICREGLSVGITVVIANAQTSGIGYKYLSNFSSRMALYCNDSSEYNNIFDSCKMRPKNVPGRCIVTYQKEYYDCQTYRAFKGEKEIDRVTEMKAFIEECNETFPDMKAKVIPEIPEVLSSTFITSQYALLSRQKNLVIAGLDYSSVEPVPFDVQTMGVLGITGRPKSGKGNFARYFVETARANNPNLKLYVIDDITRKFACWKQTAQTYSINPTDIGAILDQWEQELKSRYDQLMDGKNDAFDRAPLLVLVVQNEDVFGIISGDSGMMAKYKTIVTKYKNMRMCVLFANMPNENISYSSPEVLKMIKENRNILVFDNLQNFKPFELAYSILKEYKKPIENGDGYWIRGNDVFKLKTPLLIEKS